MGSVRHSYSSAGSPFKDGNISFSTTIKHLLVLVWSLVDRAEDPCVPKLSDLTIKS